MRVYKFTIDVSTLSDPKVYENVDNAFKSLLGDVNQFVGYAETDDSSKMIMYFYSDGDKTMSGLYDILLDYRLLIDVKDITEDMKLDYTQFKGIDDVTNHNYDLLRKFINSEFSDDFILDYVAKNGKDRLKTEILEKFFPNF